MASDETVDRKALIREYRETPRTAGVYRVTHAPSGRTLVGSSPDVPAMLNRIKAQLRMGAHRNARLQKDWNDGDPGDFVFEIVDTLSPRDDPAYDPSADLRELAALWVERLARPGDEAY